MTKRGPVTPLERQIIEDKHRHFYRYEGPGLLAETEVWRCIHCPKIKLKRHEAAS